MKRPHFWLRRIALLIVAVVAVQYALLTWFLPRCLIKIVRRLTDNQLVAQDAKVSPQLTAVLGSLRTQRSSRHAVLSVQQLMFHPKQLWLAPRFLEMESIDVERPFIRATRTAAGAFLWPEIKNAVPEGGVSHSTRIESRVQQFLRWVIEGWHLQINVLRITNGTVEFIDEWPAVPFHLAFEHATVSIGPVSFPDQGDPVSFAIRGLLTGFEGKAAPAYCSGWVTRQQGGMEISCQLEPLPLAIFDPYFQEYPVVRVYSATMALTSQWTAKNHKMEAHWHIELDHLDEGDISVHGHTILNMKKLAKEGERRLIAEIALEGDLEHIESWKGRFIPGNEPAQRLVEHLLEREIKVLRVAVGGRQVGLLLTSAGGIEMQDIQAASKEISEALELLAAPVVFSVPVNVSPPYITDTAPIVFSVNTVSKLALPDNSAPASLPEEASP